PIHILGRIQSFGFLLAFSADWMLVHASQNVDGLLGRGAEALLGQPAQAFLSLDAIHLIGQRRQDARRAEGPERMFGVDLLGNGALFDVAVHLSDGLTVVEVERCGTSRPLEAVSQVRAMVAKVRAIGNTKTLLDNAAREMRVATGFDRVMLYRFLEDGSGEVQAEAKADHVDSFLGLRYPASDIPQQARALYLKNRFRIIAAVNEPSVAITPPLSPQNRPLDLSRSILRSVSPIHIEYLRNMGVGASLSVSVVVDGALWGLFACHHMTPRHVPFEQRTVVELFAEVFALELESRLRSDRYEEEARARAIHEDIMSTVALDGTPYENLVPHIELIAKTVGADGLALWMDREYALHGIGPTRAQMTELVGFLNRSSASTIFSTSELSRLFEPALAYASDISGVLAIPISRQPRDYVVFFRRETVQSLTWAGNPDKPVDGKEARISPRKSFEAYRQIKRNQSTPWSDSDRRIAETLRITLLEVMLRSVDNVSQIRQKAKETQDLLIAELNHRVRNILTLIRGIVRQTSESATTVEGFSNVLGGRIQSLARAHDQLTQTQTQTKGQHAILANLINNELDAYGQGAAGRIRLAGPDVRLSPAACTCVALVFHEMVTNSAKYGALSDTGGTLGVVWSFDDSGSLIIKWQELGGPQVTTPERRGFGTSIIERAIPFELQGEAEVDYAATGVRATFTLPPAHVFLAESAPDAAGAPAVAAAPAAATADAAQPDGRSKPKAMALETAVCLLVEDNMVIAMDAEAMLLDMGFKDVLVANTAASAFAILETNTIDVAVLDINLGKETSIQVAEALVKTTTAVLFASGYGDASPLPDVLRDVPVVAKPYSESKLRDGLLRVGIG
ncbi:MAG: HWE histidine kinase domain-containing protein, partial [Pseudomonadota bacterium]